MNNHEIRFGCSVEEKKFADEIHSKVARDILKTSFYRKVFLKGIRSISMDLLKENKENILIDLMKGGNK